MPTRSLHARLALVGVVAALAAPACASLIGADFDVLPEHDDAGAGGGDAGPDGEGTGGGGACSDQPEVVAHVVYPWGITTRGGYAYWTVAGAGLTTDGAVMRVRSQAGAQPETLAKGLWWPNQIAADDHHVYWTSYLFDGGVFQAALDGGGGAELVVGEQDNGTGILVDDTTIYWISNGIVRSAPLGTHGASDGTHLTPEYSALALLARDDAGIYFTEDATDGGVHRIGFDGGVVDLANHQNMPNGIVTNGGAVYFTTVVSKGQILSMSNTGGVPKPVVGGQNQPASIAADTVSLYWTNFGDGTIRTIPLPGGTVSTIATGQDSPNGIAVDDLYVYWTNHAPHGAVMRLRKACIP